MKWTTTTTVAAGQRLKIATSIQLEAIEQFKEKYPVDYINQQKLKKAVKDFNGLINSRDWKT